MSEDAEKALEFEPLVRRLKAAAMGVSASEVHGLFCGLLCSGRPDVSEVWHLELFDHIEPGGLPLRECQRSLDRLFQHTKTQLEDPGSAFSLFLPDDGQSLKQRACALVEWCQGFLYGLGLSGVSERTFSEEIREVLRDLTEITRMDQHVVEESEDNEEAYMELSEFIRVAAMLVHGHMIAGSERDR